jgi:hypothetical protein
MGCNDCVCKPVDWGQLAKLIRKLLPSLRAPGSMQGQQDSS